MDELEWDADKAAANVKKHRVALPTPRRSFTTNKRSR